MDLVTSRWLCDYCFTYNTNQNCRTCFKVHIPFEIRKYCGNCAEVKISDHCMKCLQNTINHWKCSACGCQSSPDSLICNMCNNNKPQSSLEFTQGFQLASKDLPYFEGIFRKDNVMGGFNTKISNIDYRYVNIIGHTASIVCDDKTVPLGKVIWLRKSSAFAKNWIIVGYIDSQNVANVISFDSSNPQMISGFGITKPFYIKIQITDWNQIKPLFVPHYKPSESLLSNLPMEIIYHIIRYLIL